MNPFGNPADLAHLHLWLNHLPTIGTVVGVGLVTLAFARKNDDLKKVSLEVFCVIAVATLPAYMSGVAAQVVLKGRADVSETAMATHQDVALLALLFMEMTGAVAWFGLWQFRRLARAPRGALATVFVLAMVTLAVLTRAANLGGDIRHPEIRSTASGDAAAGSAGAWLRASSVGEFAVGHLWVWPTCETLHFIGMSLSFGVLLVVNLQVLGFMKNVPFSAVHRLLPWGMLGLGLNFVTGMVFFTGTAQQYIENPTFHWKVILIVLAGLNYLYLTVFSEAWVQPAGHRPRFTDQLMAASALFLWVGVMYFGRMLPYLRSAF